MASNQISWEIKTGSHAFGDGTHPTTAGVLAALKMLDPTKFNPRIACDVGAGSGILSFAIIEKFHCPVIAVDMLAESVATIRENASRNGYNGAQIRALQADGFVHPHVAEGAPFELIVMNILAEPLLRLAVDTEHHLAEGGVLVLSGILLPQEAPLREAYGGLGLELTSRIGIGDWVTLVWQKP